MRLRLRALLMVPLAALIMTVAACATPELPPATKVSSIAEQIYLRVQGLYLRPERIDDRVLAGALEALERRFDPVRFERDGNGGVLSVGRDRAWVQGDSNGELDHFLATLGGALEFVELRLGPELSRDLGPDENLELVALRGALGALDRYSTVFSGKSTEDFRIRFSGQLQGIGARIGRREGQLLAVGVFPGSPANRAGLQDGDAIMSIDGEPTRPMTVSDAVTKIRGAPESVVVLTVRRDEETLDIPITRGKVVVPTVESERLDSGFGYSRIIQVSHSTPKEFREKLAELGEINGLVLDLRSNTGGSMVASARLADFFLDGGTIVRTVGRGGTPVSGLRSRARATSDVLVPVPIVVLVNSSTASAAEILSGALETLPRVTLVGQRTFGKGVVQRIYPLPNKSLLKLTVAEYLLSEDRVIHQEGVEPDITLYPVSEEVLAPLANIPDGAIPYLVDAEEEDRFPVELGEAILGQGLEAGLATMRQRSEERLAAHLKELGVEWSGEATELPEPLPHALELDLQAPTLEAGQTAHITVMVRNPNDFPIPDAWAALMGALPDLAAKGLALGEIPAGGKVSVKVEVRAQDGLSAGELPVLVHVASRLRPLASRRAVLRSREQIPELEIEVVREEALAHVTLRNRGQTGVGKMRVEVPGDFRVLEELPSGSEETVELALSGDVRFVSVTQFGPHASRRVDVPLPEIGPDARISVVPPRLRVRRAGLPGFRRIRVDASDPEGLREGWISVDDQKRTYAEWGGRRSGSFSTSIPHGEHTLLSKIENVAGVAVLDSRTFITE